jgi:hypothetical protein
MADAPMRADFERCKERYTTRPTMENATEHKMPSPRVCPTRRFLSHWPKWSIPWHRLGISRRIHTDSDGGPLVSRRALAHGEVVLSHPFRTCRRPKYQLSSGRHWQGALLGWQETS